MSDDKKLVPAPLRTAVSRPALGDLPTTLPSASGAWLGSRTYLTKKDAAFVEAHTRLLNARANQCEALNTLIDKRIALGAKIADIQNVLAEHQRIRDHERFLAERRRQRERARADYDDLLTVARNETELENARQLSIRAQRNREAAERVKQSEIDAWYHAAEARRHNALAESQDTAADLKRGPGEEGSQSDVKVAADNLRADVLATLDNQIELERQRGNEAAMLALLNLRARLVAR